MTCVRIYACQLLERGTEEEENKNEACCACVQVWEASHPKQLHW